MCRIQFSVITFTQSNCLWTHRPGYNGYFQILAQIKCFFLLMALMKSCWKQYCILCYIVVGTFQLMSLKFTISEQMSASKTVSGHSSVQKIDTSGRKKQKQVNTKLILKCVCTFFNIPKQTVFSRDQFINLKNLQSSIYTDQNKVTYWELQKYIRSLNSGYFEQKLLVVRILHTGVKCRAM